jgi:hypothetical protein
MMLPDGLREGVRLGDMYLLLMLCFGYCWWMTDPVDQVSL